MASSPTPPPADLPASASALHPLLQQPLESPPTHHPSRLLSTESSISSQQFLVNSTYMGGGAAEDKHAVMEHIRQIPSTKWGNYCSPGSADSCIFQEGGHWLEEDKIFPFKKRRILLNLDSAPSRNSETVSQGGLKYIENARTGRKRRVTSRADHVLYQDYDLKGSPEMINYPTAEDIAGEESMINNITSTRCTRTNGQGWRCKQPSLADNAFCDHQWTSTRNGRRKERKKKKDSNPRKLASSKVKVVPITSCSELMQRERTSAGSARKTGKCISNVDHVFNKRDDFEVVSDVMDRIPAAKEIKMEETNMDNIATTRSTPTDGKRRRCSQPSFGGCSLCKLHLTTKRKVNKKKKNDKDSVPHKVASSKINISPSCPTALVHTETMTIGNARKSNNRTNKKWGDHVLHEDNFEGVSAGVAEKIKMEGETIDNSTNTRCARASGKGWRCSQRKFAGSSLCEHHWTAMRNRRKGNKKMNSIPRKVAGPEVKNTLNSPTTLQKRKTMNIGSARSRRKYSNEVRGDHVLCKDDNDSEGIADLMMNSTPAAKEIKTEEKTMDDITNPRCSRSNGKGWRCSQPCSSGYPLCEHHWAARKNSRGRK